jgi:hypothetical protein
VTKFLYNVDMKTRIILLLTFSLFMTSCQPTATPPPSTVTGAPIEEPSPTLTPVPPATPSETAAPTPTSGRSAAFTVVENTVESRPAETDAYAPAAIGVIFPIGGQARTGEDGRARLDLSPDGTIIRVVPNTIFTLPALEKKDDAPLTKIKLFLGQIFIILSGGELEVETPSGVATVRGSMMGVSYDPADGTMTATCLEGHCNLRNDSGSIDLTAGQAADIRAGILSREPRQITDKELGDWFEFAPELEGLRDRLPDILNTRRDRIPTRQPRPTRPPRPLP